MVLCEVRDGLCTLTLNRPAKLNSLTVAMFEQLERHLDDLEGAAGGCFSARHDLSDIQAGEAVAPGYQSRVIERLANHSAPLIGRR